MDQLTWVVINYLGYCYIKAIYQPVGDEYIVECRWAEKGKGSRVKGTQYQGDPVSRGSRVKRIEGQEDQGLRRSRVKGMKVIKGQEDLGSG